MKHGIFDKSKTYKLYNQTLPYMDIIDDIDNGKREIINIIKQPIQIIKEKIEKIHNIKILIATDALLSNLIRIFLKFSNFTIIIKDKNKNILDYDDINILIINTENIKLCKNINNKTKTILLVKNIKKNIILILI